MEAGPIFALPTRGDAPLEPDMATSRDLRYLLFEGLIVVFSVLVALAVDEWRENRSLDARTEVALDRLTDEIVRNRAELAELADVVEDRLERLRTLADDPTAQGSLGRLIGRFGGYRSPEFSEAAWSRLVSSPLADRVDPAFLEGAFDLYAFHPYFRGLDEEVNRLIYSELFHDPGRMRTALLISERIMVQQRIWAREALAAHDAFRPRLLAR